MSCQGNYIHWVKSFFGECISTPTEKAGFFIGLLSTLIWMYAQIPQIIMNYKRKSVEGLSFVFIIFLNLGDFCNLLGAIINDGLITQFITATWFCLVDISCLIQYIWYNWIRKKCAKQEKYHPITHSGPAPSAAPLMAGFAAAAASTTSSSPSSDPYKPPKLYGTILGWVSASFYIYSRMPQIISNFKRKRTEGLSIQFFWSAVLGNTTYALSIFLKDYHWSYIWQQFPWLVGSAGILFFDFTVLIQFLCYRKNRIEDTTAPTENVKIKHYISEQLY